MAHLINQKMPTTKAIRVVKAATSWDEHEVLDACKIVTVERAPQAVFYKALDLLADARKARLA